METVKTRQRRPVYRCNFRPPPDCIGMGVGRGSDCSHQVEPAHEQDLPREHSLYPPKKYGLSLRIVGRCCRGIELPSRVRRGSRRSQGGEFPSLPNAGIAHQTRAAEHHGGRRQPRADHRFRPRERPGRRRGTWRIGRRHRAMDCAGSLAGAGGTEQTRGCFFIRDGHGRGWFGRSVGDRPVTDHLHALAKDLHRNCSVRPASFHYGGVGHNAGGPPSATNSPHAHGQTMGVDERWLESRTALASKHGCSAGSFAWPVSAHFVPQSGTRKANRSIACSSPRKRTRRIVGPRPNLGGVGASRPRVSPVVEISTARSPGSSSSGERMYPSGELHNDRGASRMWLISLSHPRHLKRCTSPDLDPNLNSSGIRS